MNQDQGGGFTEPGGGVMDQLHVLRRRKGGSARLMAVSAVSVVLLAACGSTASGSTSGTGGSSAQTSSGSVTFGGISTFTGSSASFGPELMAGCYTAVDLINKAGGILGHQASCIPINTNGDPADAVPAVSKAIAIDHLSGVLGPGGTATATAPLLEAAGITMLADSGDSAFNKTTDTYFWRITPPDSAGGLALAAWGYEHGCKTGVAVFSNTTTAQTSVPTLLSGFKRLGGTMALNFQLVPDSSTYESQVARVIAAHPQCIFTEADPQTDATFLSEFKQLNNGQMIPIVGTEPTITTQWQKAVTGAIGASQMAKYYVGVQPYTPAQGQAWSIFNKELLANAKQIPNPSQWSSDPYSMTDYDGINIMALAMLEAKSTNPKVYNSDILSVTQPGANKVDVYSYAQGKALLAQGKQIRLVGSGGAVDFNQYHNFGGAFSGNGYTVGGSPTLVGVVSAAVIKGLSS
ncbi:MAG: ABC transporter substrate-binding protein [Acidimicrobiaceae bacterium]|nr:ABC transporter substrate-binding protein [Acidimicrobiaceae bacterium]